MIPDLSHHNQIKDWNKFLESAKLTGVILKATEGVSFIDPEFTKRATMLKNAGVKIGAYHFARPNLNYPPTVNAGNQTNHFLKVTDGFTFDLGVWLDWEEAAAYSYQPISELPPRWTYDWFQRWFDWTGGGIYSYPDLFKRLPTLPQGMEVWYAKWTDDLPPSRVVNGGTVKLWQYTSKGGYPGVTGEVDLSKRI